MTKQLDLITLTVATHTALHIGSLTNQRTDLTDSLFRRDTRGNLLLPGTGLAGALRAHLTRIAPLLAVEGKVVCDALTGHQPKENDSQQDCGCVVCHLMGDIHAGGESRASRLIVTDTILPNVATRIQDAVSIDRDSGAASRRASGKFDLEVYPAGIEFDIRLELETSSGLSPTPPEDNGEPNYEGKKAAWEQATAMEPRRAEVDRLLVGILLNEWRQGRITVGGSGSRGMGALELRDVHLQSLDLDNNLEHLFGLLARDTGAGEITQGYIPWLPEGPLFNALAPTDSSVVTHWLSINFEISFGGFFLTNDITTAHLSGFDSLSYLHLPGAGLRGALRSQAERIARTHANLESNSEADFLQRCPAAYPQVVRAPEGEITYLKNTTERLEALGKLDEVRRYVPEKLIAHFDLAEQLFGSTEFGSRLRVEDADLIADPIWKELDFVALDRFTGGAAEHLKFAARALWQPTFRGRLYLENPQPWELGWLMFTLADFRAGRVSVGAGYGKGFGRVSNFVLNLHIGWTTAFPGVPAPEPQITGLFNEVTFTDWDAIPYKEVWGQAWLDMVSTYNVPVDLSHAAADSHDPYWSADIALLYPKEA